jgi:hypothetical protein
MIIIANFNDILFCTCMKGNVKETFQRRRPTETKQQIRDSNLPTGSNIWSQVPEWA